MTVALSGSTTNTQLTLLVIEDSDTDAQLVAMALARESDRLFDIHRVASLDEAAIFLEKMVPDVVLLDLNLGASTGWPTFQTTKDLVRGRSAIVVITGDKDNEMAAEAIRQGAQDYFLKENIPLQGVLTRVLSHAAERHTASVKIQEMQLSLIRAAKLESIGHLAAGIAHEVKNPLQIIKLGLDLLGKRLPADSQDGREIVEECQHAIDRARRIINGLLNFGHVESLDLSQTSIDLVINEACELVDHDVQVSKARIVKELGPTPLLQVDSGKLVQVLVNCITNSCHAMELMPGGIVTVTTAVPPAEEVPVSLRGAAAGGPVILIEIQDNGPGISPEILPKLFEAFTTTKAPGKGTGLGLPVCRMIMNLHGGAIEIGNHPTEQGAIVHLWLPLSPLPQTSTPDTP